MDIEGQLCWTGTVRRPGGQNTGWRMVSKDSNRTDSSVSGHLVTGCDTADGWGSENCWGVKRGEDNGRIVQPSVWGVVEY